MSKRRYSQLSASIIDACKKGDAEMVSTLLAKGANVNTDSAHHRNSPYFVSDPLLHKAVRYGHVEIVKVLLSHGARVNVRNCVYETALHASPSVEISELLMDHGACINAIDAYNRTALHLAASFGAFDILRALLQRGAKLDIQTASGCTPLHNACHCFQKKSDEVVEELIKRGASINIKNIHGETPLHIAAKSSKFKSVHLLLDSGSNFDTRDNAGHTPLISTLHRLVSGFKRSEHCKPSDLVVVVKLLVDVGPVLDHAEAADMVVSGPVRQRESAVEEWQRLVITHHMVRFLIQAGCGTQGKINEKVLRTLVNSGDLDTFSLLQDCGYRLNESLLIEICGSVKNGKELLRHVRGIVSLPPSLQCLCRITIRKTLSEVLAYKSKGRVVKVFARIRNIVLKKTTSFLRVSMPRRIVTSSDINLLPLPESVKFFLSFNCYHELNILRDQLDGRVDLPQIYLDNSHM